MKARLLPLNLNPRTSKINTRVDVQADLHGGRARNLATAHASGIAKLISWPSGSMR